jgi:hypothetical protein
MNTNPIPVPPAGGTQDNITFIRQMLGELRAVADMEGAEMLRYLLEMAYMEASDIHAGLRPLSIRGERDQSIGIAMEPTGKVKF